MREALFGEDVVPQPPPDPPETEKPSQGSDAVFDDASETLAFVDGVSLSRGPETSEGSETAEETPEELGRRRKRRRFQDRGVIAQGGFSRIHRMFDATLLREVAVKVTRGDKKPTSRTLRRFVEEAQITAQLDHPNIVPIHDLLTDDKDVLWLSMKLVEGRTLTRLLRESPARERSAHELDRLLQVFLKVCEAVAFAHSRGVVHRDLKPENIMVGSHGQVYVMDWGIAHLLRAERPSDHRSSKRKHGVILGTPAYMAPEQARGELDRIDGRADVFSLGAVLYQALTDRPPYEGRDTSVLLEQAQGGVVTPPQERFPDLPMSSRLASIAMRALRPEPEDRFPNVEALRGEVDRFLRGGFWFQEVVFPAGMVVVRQGEDADAAYIITRGICEVVLEDGGRERVLRRLHAGEVFGETAILTSGPRTATVRAVSAVRAMVVARSELERELGADSWQGAFVRTLAARFREREDTVRGLERRLAWERLHARVVELAAALGNPAVGGGVAARWSEVRQALLEENPGAEEAVAALEASGRVAIDRDRDSVRLGPWR